MKSSFSESKNRRAFISKLKELVTLLVVAQIVTLPKSALAQKMVTAQTTLIENFAKTLKRPLTVSKSLISYINTDVFVLAPSPTTAALPGNAKDIITDVIVDTDTVSISEADIHAFVQESDQLLRTRTAGIGFRLRYIYFASFRSLDPAARSSEEVNPTQVPIELYSGRTAPEYAVMFHDNVLAGTYGGYATSSSLGGAYCNRYRDINRTGRSTLFSTVMHWSHMYNACGYDRTDPIHPVRTRNVSANGECRNRAGVPCVYNSTLDHFVCSDMLPTDLYARAKTTFVATTMIHEIMHHFGFRITLDHFGTAECVERTAGTSHAGTYSPYPPEQTYFGQCPDLYSNFVAAFDDVCNGFTTAPYGHPSLARLSDFITLRYSDGFAWRIPRDGDGIRSWSGFMNKSRERIEAAISDQSQYFHFLSTDRVLKAPVGYISQASFGGDCRRLVTGQSCITFSDGYTWVVQDRHFGRRTTATGTWDGHGAELIPGENSTYRHILGTSYVTWGNTNTPSSPAGYTF